MSQPIQLCLLFFDVYLFLYLGRLSVGYCSHDVGGSEIYVWCPHHCWLVSEFSGILEIEHSTCVSLFLFWSEFLYFMCWYLQNQTYSIWPSIGNNARLKKLTKVVMPLHVPALYMYEQLFWFWCCMKDLVSKNHQHQKLKDGFWKLTNVVTV